MSVGQKWYVSHTEALTQNIVGLFIGFIILKCFGLSTSQTISLQIVIFITSYVRGYAIRRLFNWIELKK